MSSPSRPFRPPRSLQAGAILFFAVFLAGCAAPPPRPLQGELLVELERERGVPPGKLVFRSIPGGMAGHASGKPVLVAGSEPARIEIARVEPRLAMQAAAMRDDRWNPGELANPRNLRVARVGTFFLSSAATGDCENFRTSLRAERPRRGMLVYVDRAGSIRGARYTAPWIFRYELDFPSAGLYLVGVEANGTTVTQRVVADAGTLTARVRRAACANS